MAWTTPRTWVAGETVTAAQMNTHVRDNFLETAPAKASAAGQTVYSTAANALAMVPARVAKSADESVNNSTTLQNDDHLAWAVAANEMWHFHGLLYFTIASGDPGYKFSFSVPTSCTGFYWTFDALAIGSNSANNISDTFWTATINTSRTSGISAVTSFFVEVIGVIVNSTNAGTVQFQWAQNTAVASNLTLKKGSSFGLTRLA